MLKIIIPTHTYRILKMKIRDSRFPEEGRKITVLGSRVKVSSQ